VIVAQLVRAPDCGSGGRGFETPHSPTDKHIFTFENVFFLLFKTDFNFKILAKIWAQKKHHFSDACVFRIILFKLRRQNLL
jgi:hypothetical protein